MLVSVDIDADDVLDDMDIEDIEDYLARRRSRKGLSGTPATTDGAIRAIDDMASDYVRGLPIDTHIARLADTFCGRVIVPQKAH